MNMQRIVGIVLLVVGVILLVVGINASESFADQASEFFTGRFTDATMWYMIGGIAMAIVGALLVMFGGRSGGRMLSA
jgi:ABC-type phosphate transport system permease subunit